MQYVAPGSLARTTIPTKERLEAAMEEARWSLGPLRLAPWFAVKDVMYVDNVYGTADNPRSDYTATVGAGLHGYVPFSRKLVLGVYALPEYVWWKDLSNRRIWNGRYGAGLFGYFNRLTVEAAFADNRQQQYASTEFEQPVNVRERRAAADVDLRVLGRISLFGSFADSRWRYRQEDLSGWFGQEMLLLDRDETSVSGGLRMHWSDAVTFSLGAQRSTVDFQRPERDRSSSGTGPFLGLRIEGKRLRLNASVARIKLEPEPGSEFVVYDRPTGRIQLGMVLGERGLAEVYAGRSLFYSLLADYPYAEDERTGVALQTALGWRTVGRVFFEKGTVRYPCTGAVTGFDEDLRVWGGAASVEAARTVSFTFQISRERYGSAGGTRELTRVQTGMRIGAGAGEWW